jgi:hypothetical protein
MLLVVAIDLMQSFLKLTLNANILLFIWRRSLQTSALLTFLFLIFIWCRILQTNVLFTFYVFFVAEFSVSLLSGLTTVLELKTPVMACPNHVTLQFTYLLLCVGFPLPVLWVNLFDAETLPCFNGLSKPCNSSLHLIFFVM